MSADRHGFDTGPVCAARLRRKGARSRVVATVLCLGVVLGGTACTAKNVYLAHHTVVGVSGALNTNNSSGHLMVGYDRGLVGVIPRTGTDRNGEAMSTRVCSEMEVNGISLTKFRESVATGDAVDKLDGTGPFACN